jgi:4-hydroxythreonine-4-phosphate dehydrogenase
VELETSEFTESEQDKALPGIGITMGDAAGIGPEVVLKALKDENPGKKYLPAIIGDVSFLKRAADDLDLRLIFSDAEEGIDTPPGVIPVFDLANLPGDVAYGEESGVTGKASAEYIEKAVELWRANKINAIATAPISKRAISLGGYDFPGHTEFLAALTGAKKFRMSFFAGKLRVVLLSTHISLRDAIERVKKDALVDLISFSCAELSKLLGKRVKVAVAGLNPHASEGGMFGNEEAAEIVPAVNECRGRLGLDVSGPYSPDTIFLRGYEGQFDAVIACYHDQATIAVKSLSFGESVNVTLGLPLVRTSVDHGTAFDIAGKGIADASSMKAAIGLAANLIRRS